MVLEAVASYVESMLTEMREAELRMPPGVLGEIQSMGDKLGELESFLADADRRSITELPVQHWIAQLKQAMYRAADIIDLCQLEAMERGSSAADGAGCFSPLFFSKHNHVYAHTIRSRIKGLNQKLDQIRVDGAQFNLIMDLAYEDYRGRAQRSRMHGTDVLLERSGIVGEKIEEDTQALVDKIIQTRGEVNNNIMVVAIVGVCGIGKTTLAKKVFNDQAIQGEFDKKIWLSVNKDFDQVDLMKTAITAAGGDLHHEVGETLGVLQSTLTAALTGKKVLLVMDDVWNPAAWVDLLKYPFAHAAQGSQVLITTRNERVAQGMGAEHPYHRVNKLDPEDAWLLMKKQVIFSEMDELEIDKLKDIGLQIIANCGGLPLAVKVMGGLLCQKDRQQRDWKMVLHDFIPRCQLPEELNHSVYLSYQDLSPCLKQCFLHYSLLPTNIVFYENDIVGMWISEGFVQGNSQELEELGSGYYSELILMNLIEKDARYTTQRVCYMNDVVRSFAQFICKNEALVAHNGEMFGYLSAIKFYRLSLKSKGLESDMLAWSLLQEQTSLRTLVSIGQIKLKLGDSLMAFSTLRTLHIESTNAAVLVESYAGFPRSIEFEESIWVSSPYGW